MESQNESTTTGSTDPVELTEEAAELFERLQQERDQAVDARTRALADYANFQRRASENETRAREQGIAQVVRALIPVLDQFNLALGQDSGEATAQALLEGLTIVRGELTKAFEQNGITPIQPQVGDAFDPVQHEAMLQQPGEGVEPGHVSLLVQGGWAMGSQVLRPAKVAIAPEDA